jgi:hypothetical protein
MRFAIWQTAGFEIASRLATCVCVQPAASSCFTRSASILRPGIVHVLVYLPGYAGRAVESEASGGTGLRFSRHPALNPTGPAIGTNAADEAAKGNRVPVVI